MLKSVVRVVYIDQNFCMVELDACRNRTVCYCVCRLASIRTLVWKLLFSLYIYKMAMILINKFFLQLIGVEGGFGDQEPEYDETFEITILPDFILLPFPSVDLPEKVVFTLYATT